MNDGTTLDERVQIEINKWVMIDEDRVMAPSGEINNNIAAVSHWFIAEMLKTIAIADHLQRLNAQTQLRIRCTDVIAQLRKGRATQNA